MDLITGETFTLDSDPVLRLPRVIVAAAVVSALAIVVALVLSLAAFLGGSSGGLEPAELEAATQPLQAELDRVRVQIQDLEARVGNLSERVVVVEETVAESANGTDESFAPLADRVLRSVFTVETRMAFGTGWVAWTDEDATYVITANHVVEDSPSPFITLDRRDGSWSGEIVRTDPENDLALIRVSGTIARADPLWQNPKQGTEPRPGDQLLLVGSPYGLDGTVTTGIVSRVTDVEIQTDAAANPGNSGGPALAQDGLIVGVLVAGGGQNLNFAVPIERACGRIRDC